MIVVDIVQSVIMLWNKIQLSNILVVDYLLGNDSTPYDKKSVRTRDHVLEYVCLKQVCVSVSEPMYIHLYDLFILKCIFSYIFLSILSK